MKSCCKNPEVSDSKGKTVALVGNPNVGKTLIFNHLTGTSQRVANFPGVTVTSVIGEMHSDVEKFQIIDLPGSYGLASTKKEEPVTSKYILENHIDLIINIVDVTRIERNLLLTIQLMELGIPMIIVLTRYDKLPDFDTNILKRVLNLPVLPINATKGRSLNTLTLELERIERSPDRLSTSPKKLEFGELRNVLDKLYSVQRDQEEEHNSKHPEKVVMGHIFGVPGFENTPEWMKNLLNKEGIQKVDDLRLDLISQMYEFIESNLLITPEAYQESELESLADKILLDGKTGIPIFFIVMTLVFWVTFFISAPITNLLDSLLINFGEWVRNIVSNELMASFLADGVIGGIGFVMVFLPQIAILFLFLAVLDHSGYMSRVIFVMDRYLNRLNISGRSLAPMLLGFGCNVPAVLSTSNIPDENERITVALVNPFLPCSARFPVFVVFAAAVFGKYAAFAVASMYFIGILIAIFMMLVLRKTVLPGESTSLLLELNELSMPPLKTVLYQSFRQIRKFIEGAASWMGMGILFIWLLSITGPSGYIGPSALGSSSGIKSTWIYFLGNLLEPLFAPFHWDARLITALLFGFVAKEIVVGSLGIIFGTRGSDALITQIGLNFTPVIAYSYMLFVLIYVPCLGTYFALRREVGSKWANLSIVFGILIAWIVAFITTIIGGMIFG